MDLLQDPANDRPVKDLPTPPLKPLDNELMFPEANKFKPDWKLLRDHLFKEGRVSKESLIQLVRQADKIFKNEPNLLHLQDPLTIVGDIHGQFYDLLKILEVGGDFETTKYVFLGDYVDRGSYSIEVMILLYALKINYPKQIFMLRGNHECRQLTVFFNFFEEVRYKYDQEVYDVFMDSFDNFPLACIVNGQFIALHGGISPELQNTDDINQINRFVEPPKSGLFCDLIWADPVENDDGVCESSYRQNETRGCSYFYGAEAVQEFLERNNLISVIRAHEAQLEGYKMHRWGGETGFPMVITVFSAPNYCDCYNNKGAVIKFDNNALNIQQFNYADRPYSLPDFMDIFTWSVPFVAEKVTEMLYHILSATGQDDDDEVLDEDIQKFDQMLQDEHDKKTEKFRNKVKFVSKMMKMQKLLRMENESIMQLKGMCPDRRIPKGLLSGNQQGLKDAVGSFTNAKQADSINEKRPTKH